MNERRRDDDRSIPTLTMAVERLAEAQANMALSQSQMSNEIKDLAKTISKLDVVMEKMINIEDRHTDTYKVVDERLRVLEKNQIDGCPALREVKVGHEGKYEKIASVLTTNKENIEKTQYVINRVAWGVVSVVGLAVLGLVVK